MSTMDVWRGIT